MIKRIKIPGTRETKTCIRVYTCYNHQLKRNVVDTEKFFDDIETPKNFNFGNHDTCVSLIKKWAENKSDKTLLAYQGVRVEFIKDDRSSLGHQSFSSQKDLGTIGQKIFVFSDFRILISDRILSMKNLGEDVAWIQKILKSSGLARDRYEKEARDRELVHATTCAYEALVEKGHDEEQMLLKIGSATYVAITDEIAWNIVQPF